MQKPAGLRSPLLENEIRLQNGWGRGVAHTTAHTPQSFPLYLPQAAPPLFTPAVSPPKHAHGGDSAALRISNHVLPGTSKVPGILTPSLPGLGSPIESLKIRFRNLTFPRGRQQHNTKDTGFLGAFA